jgi:hypothetical protein
MAVDFRRWRGTRIGPSREERCGKCRRLSDRLGADIRKGIFNSDRLVGFEVQVSLNRKAEFAADGAKFGEAYVA